MKNYTLEEAMRQVDEISLRKDRDGRSFAVMVMAHGRYYVMNLIRDFPAEDAVAPVRCRDCRYSQWMSNTRLRCREWNGKETRPDGYCWKGKTWD